MPIYAPLPLTGEKTLPDDPHNSIFGKSSLFQEKEQNSGNSLDIFLVEFDLAGDANGDGIVNAADANIVMRWALGL